MKTTKPMLDYLATCSKTSLESFVLARLNERSNFREQILELLDAWTEADIQARLGEWILVHRRQGCSRRPARSAGRLRSKANPLPLFPSQTDPPGDFPALSVNSLLPAVGPAASNESAATPQTPQEVMVPAKRIA